MKVRYFQKGFNYSQDGPGNRLVIHFQGCNLHCPWCSNPEGMALEGGKEEDAAKLADEIESCKRLFFDGGGVTFTGGECTVQREALYALLCICKARHIHTAVETNGTCPYGVPLSEADLIICDFKHYDAEKLKERTGMCADYRKNIGEYLRSGKETLVRTVLIHGFNAGREDAENFARFFDGLPTENARFEFLPYHEYGKSKWKALGKEYTVKDAFIPPGTVEMFENVYLKHKLKTIRS